MNNRGRAMKKSYLWLGSGLLAAVAYSWWPSVQMVGSQSIDEWTRGLEHPDPTVRAETILAIEDLRDRAQPLVPYLLAMTRDPHPVARGRAVLALVTVDRKEVYLPVLVRALRDPSPTVRMDAVMGLQLFGNAGIPGLIHALQDPEPTVLIGAAFGLGRCGAEAGYAIPALTILKRHDSYRVVEAAKEALELITGIPE